MAAKEAPYQQFVNVNDDRFLNPANMIEEFQAYCRETGQKVPETPGEIARCVYDNLALCYAVELKNLQAITGRKINKLHIVGGGSNNRLLNQLTADACNVTVEAGPGEATAIGNLVVQMVATSGFGDLASARKAVRASFDLHTYEPSNPDAQAIVEEYETFLANQCQLARV